MPRRYFDAKGNPVEIAEPKSDPPNRVYYDTRGNRIDIREPSSEPPTQSFDYSKADYSKLVHPDQSKPDFDKELRDYFAATTLHQSAPTPSLGSQGVDALPTILGLAGSAGGPVGMGTGSLVGDLLRKMIQKQSLPDSGDVLESAATAAPDFLIPGIGEALSTKEPLLKAKLAKMLFSGNQTAERNAALSVLPGAEPSVGQMTGSRATQLMEDYLAPSASKEFKTNGAEALTRQFERLAPGTAETRAASIRDALEVGKKQLEAKIGDADTSLRSLGNHNTVSYDIVTGQRPTGAIDASGNAVLEDIVEPKKVTGPVYPVHTIKDAEAFLTRMREDYGAKSNVELVNLPKLAESDRPLVNMAMNIADTKAGDPIKNWSGPIGEQISATGVHPINLSTALDWKTSSGNLGFKKPVGGDNIQRLWGNINRSLDKDIAESTLDWQGGPQANQFYKTRNALNSQRQAVYLDKAPATQGLLESKGITSGTENVNEILSDPVKLGKALAGSPNRETTRQDLLGTWVEKVYGQAKKFDPATQKTIYDPSGPMNAFSDPANEKILNRLVPNAVDKQNLGKFFQSVSILEPGQPMSRSIAIRTLHGATNIILPFVTGAFGGAGTGAAVAGVEVGLNQFVKRVLLNPEVARLIPRLSSLPPSSPEGRAISRLIFSALKGVEMTYTDANGDPVNK